MLFINPDHLYAGYGELETIYGALNGCSLTAAEVDKYLAGDCGMDDIAAVLHRTIVDVGNCIEQYRGLFRSIDMICQIYASCERRVSDSGEGAIIRYAQPSAELVDLTSTLDVLEEFSFLAERGTEYGNRPV